MWLQTASNLPWGEKLMAKNFKSYQQETQNKKKVLQIG